jgi:hypothetical protein
MWPVMHDLGSRGLHADALFASGLQPCEEPGVAQVRQPSPRRSAHSAALAVPDGWRRSSAIISRRRGSGCAGRATRRAPRSRRQCSWLAG